MNKFFIRKEAAAGKRILANSVAKVINELPERGGLLDMGALMRKADKLASAEYYKRLAAAQATRRHNRLVRALGRMEDPAAALKGVKAYQYHNATKNATLDAVRRSRNISNAFTRSLTKDGYPGKLESLGLLSKYSG